ncbi:MarR family winged helix-turn-helix transcriptional regulator [Kitasatospora sp. NBC_00315]|uniref:MarR family winged helix-turn-helix transcriptional regulator n=1 Tax=Kitasatospora sp. NBC_00315 TaxID=2975963 RepID=UPI00324F0FC8
MTTTSPRAPGRTDPLHARLQYEVAVLARRLEQVRSSDTLGALDRAAYLLLDRLERQGPANIKALADALGIDSSTVTRQAAPLVGAALVGRVRNPADRRAVRLALTPLGTERLAEVRAGREELMRRLVQDWPADEQRTLCSLLARFNDSLESYSAGPQDERIQSRTRPGTRPGT